VSRHAAAVSASLAAPSAKGRDKTVAVAGLDVAEVLRRLASADPAAEDG
jgi:hypothetical protein